MTELVRNICNRDHTDKVKFKNLSLYDLNYHYYLRYFYSVN